jgi:hypothetical protein
MINDELFALLNGSADIAAMVSGRIYPVQAPEDQPYTGPYIVYSRVGNKSEEWLGGSAGLSTARYQFSSYAKPADGGNKTCRQLCELIRLLLQNYRGGSIQNCSHLNDLDMYESQLFEFHVPSDWSIQFSEPIPS